MLWMKVSTHLSTCRCCMSGERQAAAKLLRGICCGRSNNVMHDMRRTRIRLFRTCSDHHRGLAVVGLAVTVPTLFDVGSYFAITPSSGSDWQKGGVGGLGLRPSPPFNTLWQAQNNQQLPRFSRPQGRGGRSDTLADSDSQGLGIHCDDS